MSPLQPQCGGDEALSGGADDAGAVVGVEVAQGRVGQRGALREQDRAACLGCADPEVQGIRVVRAGGQDDRGGALVGELGIADGDAVPVRAGEPAHVGDLQVSRAGLRGQHGEWCVPGSTESRDTPESPLDPAPDIQHDQLTIRIGQDREHPVHPRPSDVVVSIPCSSSQRPNRSRRGMTRVSPYRAGLSTRSSAGRIARAPLASTCRVT